jgi:hypothetical protein
LRNAVYTGTWLTDAKSKFSKRNCAAYGLASDYIGAKLDRQGFLETALNWISKGEIEKYMSTHQHAPNANELWMYFLNVINWVKLTFPTYRKHMKGVNWGSLYDQFKDGLYDTAKLEQEIAALMMDDDVTNKKGIYPYVLTRKEKYLNIRAFSDSQKSAAYERQKGICPKCGKHFALKDMQADHTKPWSQGGKTSPENCQMLCQECHELKSGVQLAKK